MAAIARDRAVIDVWRIDSTWHPCPWRFAVTYQGVRREFGGMPNQCETRRQATARALWRARWLEQGTLEEHYR